MAGQLRQRLGPIGTTSYGPVISQPPFWPGTAANPVVGGAWLCAGGAAPGDEHAGGKRERRGDDHS